MNNAKLIDALRETDFGYVCEHCEHEDMCRDNDCVIIQAADALEAAEKRIAELEAQLPKECEFKSYADKIPNARNRYCTQCGAYLSDEEFENHTIRYCYFCGSKVKGEQE